MSDDFFPGFQEDEKPATPQKKPTKPSGDAAFNPFDEPVNVLAVPSTTAPPPAPKSSAKPRRKSSAGFDAFAGSQNQEEADDADLKPGSRKDLWICPHCGAGNRPNRDTCRSCGKSPDEAVAAPWFKQPIFLMGIGGAVIGLILLYLVVSGPSFALGPASTAGIGEDVVTEQAAGDSIDFGDNVFIQQGRFAAVGRLHSIKEVDGFKQLTLVFGDQARDAGAKLIARGNKVGIQNGLGNFVASPTAHITLLDPDGRFDAATEAGAIVSLTGQWGELDGVVRSSPGSASYVVLINGYRTGL